jgi:hypothetical protein
MKNKKEVKEDYEDYEDIEDIEDYASCPPLQCNLNVLVTGADYCLLKDEISNNIYSVEKNLSGEVILKKIKKGRLG